MLFTERGGGLGVRLTDGTVRRGLFRPADFVAQDQSGMLGIAIDPAFATNRSVYVYMASSLPSSTGQSGTNNRVVRLTVNADYTAFSNRVDIVTGISYSGGAHSGGRIKFGPDGYLYITTGDNRIGEIPQLLTVLGSKVLRVDRDGNAAPGNATPPAAMRASTPSVIATRRASTSGPAVAWRTPASTARGTTTKSPRWPPACRSACWWRRSCT